MNPANFPYRLVSAAVLALGLVAPPANAQITPDAHPAQQFSSSSQWQPPHY